MEAKEERYTSWETIQKQYPDRFVLLENPVFDPRPYLKEAILLYKHKSRKNTNRVGKHTICLQSVMIKMIVQK
jgi:hypothetical protein